MTKEIIVPQAGQDLEEVTVVRWMKDVGEKVNVGDVVLEIESDKAILEVEAYEEGILTEKLAKEGDVVRVLTPIAYLA